MSSAWRETARDNDTFLIKDVEPLVREALAPSRSMAAREREMMEAAKKARSRR